MKSAIRTLPVAMTVAMLGLSAMSVAQAATNPSYIGNFNQTSSQVLKTKSTSWRDPAFGDMGWTHNSGWGKVWAKAGQVVTIKAVASHPNLHPGITVWYRGVKDTAPDNYVADHFYAPNANQLVLGATDEATGAVVGNIMMSMVKFGFDKDQNNLTFAGSGLKDGVSGQLVFKFTAQTTGTYLFVIGGFSPPLQTLDPSVMYDVQTTVKVMTPTLAKPVR